VGSNGRSDFEYSSHKGNAVLICRDGSVLAMFPDTLMKMEEQFLLHLAVLVILLIPLCGQTSPVKQTLISKAGSTGYVSATDPRPLEQALDALQKKYGWGIDYEDPPYTSQSGSGGTLNAEFALIPNTPPDQEKTLRAIIDSYNQSKNPGRFELRTIASRGFDVVGISANDKHGHLSQQEVSLDSPVTIPVAPRSASETIALICEKIAQRSAVNIHLGVYPRNVLDYTSVTVGGNASPARTLLTSTLAATSHKIYWRMLFDPNSNSYYLNLHSVSTPKP